MGRSVMESALGDLKPLVDALTGDPVDEAIGLGDAAGPPTVKIASQRLWLAKAGEGVAPAFLDQGVKPRERFGVGVDPVEVVLPGRLREDQLHGWTRSRSLPPPASSWRTDARSRAALAGVESRCRVSSVAF